MPSDCEIYVGVPIPSNGTIICVDPHIIRLKCYTIVRAQFIGDRPVRSCRRTGCPVYPTFNCITIKSKTRMVRNRNIIVTTVETLGIPHLARCGLCRRHRRCASTALPAVIVGSTVFILSRGPVSAFFEVQNSLVIGIPHPCRIRLIRGGRISIVQIYISVNTAAQERYLHPRYQLSCAGYILFNLMVKLRYLIVTREQ